MIAEHEEIMGININYDAYVKRDIDQYRLWMPFTYEVAAAIFKFVNDNFWFEKEKPEIMVSIHYDYASRNRAIELSVRIKETGYGEAELFTMDIFGGSYHPEAFPRGFVGNFMERFQRNLIRSAVMEKIELYRNPPMPKINWRLTRLTGLALANTAIWLSSSFVFMAIILIYICLKTTL